MSTSAREHYVQEILGYYRRTPQTRGRVRPADRRLAEDLFRRGVEAQTVKAALVLAAGRRTFRDPELGILEPIASLHYFLPVIQEIQRQTIDPEYFEHVEDSLKRDGVITSGDHRST